MRLLFITLLLAAVSCTGPKKTNKMEHPLDGTWLPVKEEFAGTPLPPAAFQNQKLELAGDTYTFTAESVDKGTVTTQGDKMDIYGKEGVNIGKHFMAIFKYLNGELTICYNLAGDGYPAAFDTKGKPMYFLCVFKRQ